MVRRNLKNLAICSIPIILYPNHTLLKTIRRKGSSILEPFRVYCYKSLWQSIEQLVKRKGFIDKYEKWRSREVPDGYLCDIPYKQKIWHGIKFGSWQFFVEITKFISPIANSVVFYYTM